MANEVDPRVIGTINRLFERLFRLTVRQKLEEDRYEAQLASLKRRHRALTEDFKVQENELAARLLRVILENIDKLIPSKRRSFVTLIGSVQFRRQPARTSVHDEAGAMQMARELQVVRHVATPPDMQWHFSASKFLEWLQQHPEYREKFEPFITVTPAHDSVSVKPNGYTVDYDNKRLTPPATTLGEIDIP